MFRSDSMSEAVISLRKANDMYQHVLSLMGDYEDSQDEDYFWAIGYLLHDTVELVLKGFAYVDNSEVPIGCNIYTLINNVDNCKVTDWLRANVTKLLCWHYAESDSSTPVLTNEADIRDAINNVGLFLMSNGVTDKEVTILTEQGKEILRKVAPVELVNFDTLDWNILYALNSNRMEEIASGSYLHFNWYKYFKLMGVENMEMEVTRLKHIFKTSSVHYIEVKLAEIFGNKVLKEG